MLLPKLFPEYFIYILSGACHSPLESSPMFTILHEREEEDAYCGGHVAFGAHSPQAMFGVPVLFCTACEERREMKEDGCWTTSFRVYGNSHLIV